MNRQEGKSETGNMNESIKKIWVIIPAAGIGSRMEAGKPKQYIQIGDQSLIEMTLQVVLNFAPISGVQVCISADDQEWQALNIKHEKLLATTFGGETRADSVLAGLDALSKYAKADDWVMVHDAARPCISHDVLTRFVEQLKEHPIGGLMAMPVADTLKQADMNGNVAKTVSRESMWQAQTPQMFHFQALRDALLEAQEKKFVITDEASAMEMAGHEIALIKGERANIKVTYPGDERWVALFRMI